MTEWARSTTPGLPAQGAELVDIPPEAFEDDVAERALWPRYMAAYQDMIQHTSTAEAPWHVVPADHKWFARVAIGSAIVSALDGLNLKFPRADKASLEEFKQVRKALLAEGKGRAMKKLAAGKVADE